MMEDVIIPAATPPMTQEQIVLETIAYYARNPRAVDHKTGSCLYLDRETGAECAVGRCLTRAALVRSADVIGGVADIGLADDTLQPQYRGHVRDFWVELQRLHDSNENWSPADAGSSDVVRVLSGSGLLHVGKHWPSITAGQIRQAITTGD